MAPQVREEVSRGITVIPEQLAGPMSATRLRGRGIRNPRAIQKVLRQAVEESTKSAIANAVAQATSEKAESAPAIEIEASASPEQEGIDSTMDADVLIEATVSNIRKNRDAFDNKWRSVNTFVACLLGYLYVTSTALKNQAEVWARLLAETGVKGSRRGPETPHHLLATRALLRKAVYLPPDGSVDTYGDRLRALELESVPPDVEAVRRWWTEKVLVEGKEVSGTQRAKAVLRKDSKSGAGRQGRDDEGALASAAYEAALQRAVADPLGRFMPADEKVLPNGRWVILVSRL